MARDRKRSKQRRDRGRAPAVSRGPGACAEAAPPTAAGGEAVEAPEHGIVRPGIPGALDHASADVDEFEGALVRGAGGTPAESELDEAAFGADEDERDAEDLLQTPGGGDGAGGGAGGGRGDGGAGGRGGGATPSGAPIRGGNRAVGFLRASWAELQRVQWPDRREVTQATAVVLGFVAIAGAYLGLADYVAKEIVELIIG